MSDPTSDEGLYDFAPEKPASAQRAKSPTKVFVQPMPVLPPDVPSVLPYRPAKADKAAPLQTEQIKDVYLPLGLLAGGVFIELLWAIIFTHNIGPALAELAVDLTLGTGVMLLAMLVAAKLRGIDLGKLTVAAYKLAAVSIAPAAIMDFINPITSLINIGYYISLGSIISWVVQFALSFALLGAMFDLDESDTWYCVWTLLITRIALYVALRAMFHG